MHNLAILTSSSLTEELNANWTRIIPTTLHLKGIIPEANLTDAATEIKDFYFGHKNVSKDTGIQLEMMCIFLSCTKSWKVLSCKKV